MSRILDVYLYEKLAGFLEQTDNGDLVFTYDAKYLNRASYGISLSLPLQSESYRGKAVKAYFSGLLPEESVRDHLAKYLGVSKKNPFAILEVIGGECAGALSLHPHGEKPPSVSDKIEILNDDQLKEILSLIKHRPMLAGEDGYRLSLAGAQNKLAVGLRKGHITLLKDGSPTTHILKPMIEHVTDSPHNEMFCMRLAKKIGLDVPDASLHFVGHTPYYLVERYDRKIDQEGKVARIHQEDFCQALAIPPEIKYEREGGPSIKTCQELLTQSADRPALDQIKLLNVVIFNYIIGNADAHGKNFSLLYNNSKPQLAPAYDLLCTAIYPDLSKNMAMKIGGKYKPKEVYLRHFHQLVANTKVAQTAMNRQINSVCKKTITAAPQLKETLKSEGLESTVFDEIIAVIREHTKHLLKL